MPSSSEIPPTSVCGATGAGNWGSTAPQGSTRALSWHRLQGEQVLLHLGSAWEGLSGEAAAARLQQCGRNDLQQPSRPSVWWMLLSQFIHLMALLLWAGAGIALVIDLPQLAMAIVGVILLNGVFSFWQEYRAERAIEELTRLLPHVATVLRNGEQQAIPSGAVVPGDLLVLSEGDSIPADARLLEAHTFSTSDAALTGESSPTPRSPEPLGHDPAQPAEATNCVFAGTTVASGRGLAVVTATGDRTAFGRIAGLTRWVPERPSPLQRELNAVVRAISLVAVGVGVMFALLALLLVGLNAGTALTFALGLIVAFVPEGLLPTLTLSLAMAVQRMSRRRALVKHLAAVEALGAASVIATDKTGVLTENRMMVVALYAGGREYSVGGSGYAPEGEIREEGQLLPSTEFTRLLPVLRAAALCNYARLKPPGRVGLSWEITGDPTEGALQALAAKGGVRVESLLARRRLAAEWPFDARRQRMTVAYPASEGVVALTKGSPDAILTRCTGILADDQVRVLASDERAEIDAVITRFASAGLRVLALAERPLEHDDLDRGAEEIERDLVFLGLVAMEDPPRPEVREAVRRCRTAGIHIVIVSGDQGNTVAAIGRQVGIHTAAARILEGAELADLDDASLRRVLSEQREVLFARTPPEGKLRVVRALQALGHVVAVTGDGVNDAPALRQADIGVAMGRSGTDVARATADMVLEDDNFSNIVAAIEEGRAVFDNIRKFTTYCFTSNTAEAVPFVLFLLSAGSIPLALPIMLVLAIDLGTDLFPALALGGESAEPDVMERPPRERGAHLISGGLLVRSLIWLGLLEGAAGMAAFFWVLGAHGGIVALPQARAAAFCGIVMAQVANVFVCRSERGFAFSRRWNPLLVAGIGLELLILAAVIYAAPLQLVFGTASLGPGEWWVPLLAAPIFFLLEEGRKRVARRRREPTPQRGSCLPRDAEGSSLGAQRPTAQG